MKYTYTEGQVASHPRRQVGNQWLLAKPELNFWRRVKMAWQVFKGRAMPVEWF